MATNNVIINLGTVGSGITSETVSISGYTGTGGTGTVSSLFSLQSVSSFPITQSIDDTIQSLYIVVDSGPCAGANQTFDISGVTPPSTNTATPTPTPTLTTSQDAVVPTNTPTPTITSTSTPTPTTTYITLYGCGDYITDTYTPTGYTLQTHSLDLSSATSGDLITISYNANDRPNRFNIYGNSSLIANSGWVGDDNTYPGPWGTAGSLSGVGSGTFTFYYVDSYTYELRVDVGPANPSTLASDSWTVGISCTTPTPTPTPTPTTVITYNEFFIAGGVDESTSGTTYCTSPGYNITLPIYSTASSIAGLYGNTVYTDSGGTTPYSGSGEGVMYAVRSASGGNTYDLGTFDYIVISSEGLVTFQASISCSGGPPDIP